MWISCDEQGLITEAEDIASVLVFALSAPLRIEVNKLMDNYKLFYNIKNNRTYYKRVLLKVKLDHSYISQMFHYYCISDSVKY